MIVDTLKGLEEFEAGLWKIADKLLGKNYEVVTADERLDKDRC